MRIAFYAPLKSPDHPVPSGDRRVARLLVQALEQAGHEVTLASSLRTFEPKGNSARQLQLRDAGLAEADALIEAWSKSDAPPDLWFTYHVYYKAPDWLGPGICNSLGIPYVIAEASFAPKRAEGPWTIGHEAAGAAIRAAALVLCPTRDDMECVRPVAAPSAEVAWLPPFLDPAPYQLAARGRVAQREKLATQHGLDRSVPWIVVVAMMRPGDKVSSFRMLADTLGKLRDIPWQVVIAGDGAARTEVQEFVEAAVPGRARFVGQQPVADLAQIYAACDLCLWPAVNEAYGMAMLEAQAAGVPVVSRSVRGVPDVVCDGRTGLLAPAGDEDALSRLARVLLTDPDKRAAFGQAAAQFAGGERSLQSTATRLGVALHGLAKGGNRLAVVRRT
jgi:glycosyltransferase involved in cell wall biosynthesis